MMDNSEQIGRLTSKLAQLVEKYLKLQQDNDSLNATIEKLILEKESLINEKIALQKDVSKYTNISKEQGDSIDSMLGKIESLLGSDDKDVYYKDDKNYANKSLVQENDNHIETSESNSDESILTVNQESNITNNNNFDEKNNNNSKLDLERMSSLLNGFD